MPVELRSLDIATSDGVCDARVAIPADGTFPGVLFCMDAYGLRDVTDAWIEQIAGEGYVVLAPNLLYRGARCPLIRKPPAQMSDDERKQFFEGVLPQRQALSGGALARDFRAYIDVIDGMSQTKPGPIGVTGYCMGGSIALQASIIYPERVAAVACFHTTNLATDADTSPHRSVDRIAGEVYLAYADHDAGAPPEQQERLSQALGEAGVRFKSEVYLDAPHGYTMSDTAAYRPEAAERHFRSLIDLLNRNLKG